MATMNRLYSANAPADKFRLMAVLAHPDDETLALGGLLARYADEDVETHLVCATRGEYGWFDKHATYPGPQALGRLREAELRAAAAVLKLHDVQFMDYIDGHLDSAPYDEVVGKLVAALRRARPQVVVTFDPYGIYGHPDHIAISQFTTAAMVAAADPNYRAPGLPHRVDKLYYVVDTPEQFETYQAAFGELVMTIDGVERRASGWQPWAVTTAVDTAAYREQVWQAVDCHQSQLREYAALKALPEQQRASLFREYKLYRAFSLVNGGRATEADVFEGLRALPMRWTQMASGW